MVHEQLGGLPHGSLSSKSSSLNCRKLDTSDQVIMCSEVAPLQIILFLSILCAIFWYEED